MVLHLLKSTFLICGFVCFCAPLKAAENFRPSLEILQTAIQENTMRVEEFQYIRKEAEKLGVRAWLFGGTAAAYSHYVNWDLQRQSGDPRYQQERFDYDYTNIYRSTQDLDIVIDGTPEQAQELQKLLVEKFQHFQGSKTAWEVRLLRENMGDKLAILHNPDFLHQHSDSNSTGMVEVTQTPPGEQAIKDVMDWDSAQPFFLRDVHENKLHYYYNPQHESTKYYKDGRNPEIFSVIRYLTKAFQFELELRPEDLRKIREIVEAFDPKGKEMRDPYVRNWLLNKENGRKLFLSAVNLEYAANALDDLGLRTKLVEVEGGELSPGTFSWLLNREPLRSFAVGGGDGKTAKALGIGTVAHVTKDFFAYESITKAHTGDPNVLASRKGKAGETAVYGDGFYTQKGDWGAWETGFNIRFRVKPEAKEGSDFTYDKGSGYVVFKNKQAFTVIPDSLDWTNRDYFNYLASGEVPDSRNRGVFEKLRRRLLKRKVTAEERTYIDDLVLQSTREGKANPALYEAWFKSSPTERSVAEVLRVALTLAAPEGNDVELWAQWQDWNSDFQDLLSDFLKSKDPMGLPKDILPMVSAVMKSPQFNFSLVGRLLTNQLDAHHLGELLSEFAVHPGVPEEKKAGILTSWFGKNYRNSAAGEMAEKVLPLLSGMEASLVMRGANLSKNEFTAEAVKRTIPGMTKKLMDEGFFDSGGLYLFFQSPLTEQHPDLVTRFFQHHFEIGRSPNGVERRLLMDGEFSHYPVVQKRLRALVQLEMASIADQSLVLRDPVFSGIWMKFLSGTDPVLEKEIKDRIAGKVHTLLGGPDFERGTPSFLLKIADETPFFFDEAATRELLEKGDSLHYTPLEIRLIKYFRALGPKMEQWQKTLAVNYLHKYLDRGKIPTAIHWTDPNQTNWQNGFAVLADSLGEDLPPQLLQTWKKQVLNEVRAEPDKSVDKFSWPDTWFKSTKSSEDREVVDALIAEGRLNVLFYNLARSNVWWESDAVIDVLLAAKKVLGGKVLEMGAAAPLSTLLVKNLEKLDREKATSLVDWLLKSDAANHIYRKEIFRSERIWNNKHFVSWMLQVLGMKDLEDRTRKEIGIDLMIALKGRPELATSSEGAELMRAALLMLYSPTVANNAHQFASDAESLFGIHPQWRAQEQFSLWQKVLSRKEPASILEKTNCSSVYNKF